MFYLWLVPLVLVGGIGIWALYLAISRGEPETAAPREEPSTPVEDRHASATTQGDE